MGGSLGTRRVVLLFCHQAMHDQPWDLNYCWPLIYSKWPRVAQIKTNSGQLQFILKRSLGEIQLTSYHTCLLVRGGRGDHFLISLYSRCMCWQSDINHRVIKQTPRSRTGSHGLVRNSHLYYWPPLMQLFPFGSASHISAAVTTTDNILGPCILCVTQPVLVLLKLQREYIIEAVEKWTPTQQGVYVDRGAWEKILCF